MERSWSDVAAGLAPHLGVLVRAGTVPVQAPAGARVIEVPGQPLFGRNDADYWRVMNAAIEWAAGLGCGLLSTSRWHQELIRYESRTIRRWPHFAVGATGRSLYRFWAILTLSGQ